MESQHRNPNFTTDRPVAVLMVFLASVVFGYFSLGQLPVTLMPEMSYPTLTVRTEYRARRRRKWRMTSAAGLRRHSVSSAA